LRIVISVSFGNSSLNGRCPASDFHQLPHQEVTIGTGTFLAQQVILGASNTNQRTNPMTDKTIDVWVAADPIWVAVDPNGKISPHLACSIDSEIAAQDALAIKLHGDAWIWNALKNRGWTVRFATLTIEEKM
jgi:hypothetical protein